MTWQEFLAEELERDPEFRRLWEEGEPEYQRQLAEVRAKAERRKRMTGWEEFLEEWRSGWVNYFAGFMLSLGVSLVALVLFFTFFSLYHRDYPLAVYSASLAAAGLIGYRLGRKR